MPQTQRHLFWFDLAFLSFEPVRRALPRNKVFTDMLNFVALGLLFSSLGAVIVLNPQPYLRESTNNGKEDPISSPYLPTERVSDVIPDSSREVLDSIASKVKQTAATLRDSAETVAQKVGFHQEEPPIIDDPSKDKGSQQLHVIGDKAAAFESDVSQKAADTGHYTVDRMKDSSEGIYSAEDDGIADTVKGAKESLKKIYEEAKRGLRQRAKDTASYMPCVGEGISWSGCQEESPKEKNQKTSQDVTRDGDDKEARLQSKVNEFCQWFHNETSRSNFEKFKEWFGSRYDGTKERLETKEASENASEDTFNVTREDTMEGRLLSGAEGQEVATGLVGSLCSSNWTTGVVRVKRVFCKCVEGAAVAVSRAVHSSVFRLIYLFNYSLVYGVSMWVTFVSGYVLSKIVPRHQFGFVQSKIFPVYLRMVSSGTALCLLLHSLLHPPWARDATATSSRSHLWQYLVLVLSLLSSLLNTFVLEPRITKVMVEKLKLDKEEGRGQASLREDVAASNDNVVIDEVTKARILLIDRKFKALHGYSSLLNLVTIMGLTWHLWYLSNRLVI